MSSPSSQQFAVSAESAAHSHALADLIASEIARANGWITFARYMELALYAPGLGYYAGGATKFGGAGDFVTAPEISSLFSRTLARQVAQVLALTDGDVLELGAGTGRMTADLLQELARLGQSPQRYLVLEVSAELAARQRKTLGKLDGALSSRVVWIDRLPDSFRGVIVANEVLDALPVHLIVWEPHGIFERGVARSRTGFVWEDRPLGEPDLLARAQRLAPPPTYLSEISLAAPALVRTLGGLLQQGAMIFVDYGFGEREYYHPQRDRGTLMCHFRHRAHDDPFFLPGLQDITAHVDFTAVASAVSNAGLELAGYTNQAQFLINLGITDALLRTSPQDAAAYLPLAAQAQKLLSPAEMGELFKVIAFSRGVGVPLMGFASGDKSRLL